MKKEKLVRDKIPAIMHEDGKEANVYTVSGDEHFDRLKEKLQEEVAEFIEDEALEELADIIEVIYAICKQRGISWDRLEEFRKLKAEKRGSFDKGRILVLED